MYSGCAVYSGGGYDYFSGGEMIVNPIAVIKKIGFMFGKISNPPFFLYLIFHYIKKDIPYCIAQRIFRRNMHAYLKADNDLLVQTYDGSNQPVHPDMVFVDNRYWLVVTPYPYGMEEYENPSVYFGDIIESLKSGCNNPIDKQKKHEIGYHLSDPCIFEINEKLICAYRENTRDDGMELSTIKYKEMKDRDWNSAGIIIQSTEDQLLSPAFYVSNDDCKATIHMLHVRLIGNGSMIVHSKLNEQLDIIESQFQSCYSMPNEYYIWHIGVTYEHGSKTGRSNDKLYGLFLMRNKLKPDVFRLYYSELIDDNTWECLKEINVPDNIERIQLHPYKSCFIPNSNAVLYSYVDKHNRYRMTKIDDPL